MEEREGRVWKDGAFWAFVLWKMQTFALQRKIALLHQMESSLEHLYSSKWMAGRSLRKETGGHEDPIYTHHLFVVACTYLFRQHFSSTIKILKWNLRLPRFALFNWLFWIYVLASQSPAKHHPGRYIQWSGEAVDTNTNRLQGHKLVVCLTSCIASIHRNNHRDGLVIENKIKKRCTWGATETRAKLARHGSPRNQVGRVRVDDEKWRLNWFLRASDKVHQSLPVMPHSWNWTSHNRVFKSWALCWWMP